MSEHVEQVAYDIDHAGIDAPSSDSYASDSGYFSENDELKQGQSIIILRFDEVTMTHYEVEIPSSRCPHCSKVDSKFAIRKHIKTHKRAN